MKLSEIVDWIVILAFAVGTALNILGIALGLALRGFQVAVGRKGLNGGRVR